MNVRLENRNKWLNVVMVGIFVLNVIEKRISLSVDMIFMYMVIVYDGEIMRLLNNMDKADIGRLRFIEKENIDKGYPVLRGSKKQLAWAYSIRKEILFSVIEKLRRGKASNWEYPWINLKDRIYRILEFFDNCEQANEIINLRNELAL